MDAGEHDLLEAGRGETLDLRKDRAWRQAPARPTRHRDDAEGTEEIAALLHLQEGPRLALEAPCPEGRQAGGAADVPDAHASAARGEHRGDELLHPAETDHVIRSEEHTSELQSHSFISYAVFCLK